MPVGHTRFFAFDGQETEREAWFNLRHAKEMGLSEEELKQLDKIQVGESFNFKSLGAGKRVV